MDVAITSIPNLDIWRNWSVYELSGGLLDLDLEERGSHAKPKAENYLLQHRIRNIEKSVTQGGKHIACFHFNTRRLFSRQRKPQLLLEPRQLARIPPHLLARN